MISKIFIGKRMIKNLSYQGVLNDFGIATVVLSVQDVVTTGNWLASSLLGYENTNSIYSQSGGDTINVSIYAEYTGNYDVFVWIPRGGEGNSTFAEYTITTLDGTWVVATDQTLNNGQWLKIATISAVYGTVVSLQLKVYAGTTRFNAIKFSATENAVSEKYDSSANQDTNTISIFANQSGYGVNEPKRATVTNVPNGTTFQIKKVNTGDVVYVGEVLNQIADFTDFNPTVKAEYHIESSGKTSYNFCIGKYWNQRVSVEPALRFMDQSRQDAFNVGGNTGYGWRDSHQFSFELNSLALQYMSNPSVYDRMSYGISNLETCEYSELRTQNEPDIIWLLKFGAMRYYDYKVNHNYSLHALIKGQLAYFLSIYPSISQYVSQAFYEQIRDMTITEWGVSACTLQWYEVGDSLDNDLFATQRFVGDIKGQKPPGYSIIPNLLMYEVAIRDGLSNAQDFLNAAYNNCAWIINEVDLDDPKHTKGQRMSERITMEGLSYFQENYPTLAPAGLLNKINRWVDVMISRSDNMWDLRKYSDPDDITTSTLDQWTGGLNQYNEVGNVAGFMASAYAAKRVISDPNKINRLKELAISHIDNVFGRNPFSRHYSYNAADEIEGADLGWFTFYEGGFGDLGSVLGVLDGSPKESAYPFNPLAPYGYTEGWVAFNTAWNESLAYSAADDLELNVFDSGYTVELSSAIVGSTLGIKLKAPLNFSEMAIESGEVIITDNLGVKTRVTVTEASVDDFYFLGQYVIPSGVTSLTISYGFGFFKVEKKITVS